MCCWTHKARDEVDKSQNIAFTLAESEDVRCQCKFGVPCRRRVTEEDLPCDWCRVRDHQQACDDIGPVPGTIILGFR